MNSEKLTVEAVAIPAETVNLNEVEAIEESFAARASS